jgi:hypothetical protein
LKLVGIKFLAYAGSPEGHTPAYNSFDMFTFRFDYGGQNHAPAHPFYFAWPVRDGDVGPIIVSIDIIPKTCTNECAIKGGGAVEVVVHGMVDFDVNDIDIASVRLEGRQALQISPIYHYRMIFGFLT